MNDKYNHIKATVTAEILANIYRLELKRFGRSYKCLCPFHGDNDPSLLITDNYKGRGYTFCKCFACGWSGSVIDFAIGIDGNIDRLIPTGYEPTFDAYQRQPKKEEKPIGTLSSEYVVMRQERGIQSDLKAFLCSVFDYRKVDDVFSRYCVGASGSDTIFWQIDQIGRVRAGKIMKYNRATGKRVKEGKDKVDWVHARLKAKKMIPEDYNLQQCLFGEHLLNGNTKPIAIVESEKTALIASLWNPSVLWLATGGKQGLTEQRLSVLRGRQILLFPDMDALEDWRLKAEALRMKGHIISVSQTRLEGAKSDLADVIVNSMRPTEIVDGCPF